MRFKQALIDLGYKHPELRPHLRNILGSAQEDTLLGELRRLEDGRLDDKAQWKAVYKLLTSMSLMSPLTQSVLARIARIRDNTKTLPAYSWGMGGFAGLVYSGGYASRRFPGTKRVMKEGRDLELFRYADGSYLLKSDTGEGYMSSFAYSTRHEALKSYEDKKSQISKYDTGFEDENDLPW